MRRLWAATVGGALIASAAVVCASAAAPLGDCERLVNTRDGVSNTELYTYDRCRFDRLENLLGSRTSPTQTAAPVTSTTPRPSATVSATPVVTGAPTSTNTPNPTSRFPNSATTGVAGCGALTRVNNGDEVAVTKDGTTIANVEYLNPVVMNIRADDVTVRCVKFNGTGYFGIDNTVNGFSAQRTVIDQVDMSCQRRPQIVGMLIQDATATRLNVHDCDHMINVAGDKVTVSGSYCHDLTDAEVVHADCIQDTGGHDATTIRGNAFYGRDTSDVLLGQEGGDSRNTVIDGNLFSSVGTPPPAYLLYLSGVNTKVTNNVFTRQRSSAVGGYTYGVCTDNTGANDYSWSGNTWADTGAAIPGCG